jgi:hypothetical protein
MTSCQLLNNAVSTFIADDEEANGTECPTVMSMHPLCGRLSGHMSLLKWWSGLGDAIEGAIIGRSCEGDSDAVAWDQSSECFGGY